MERSTKGQNRTRTCEKTREKASQNFKKKKNKEKLREEGGYAAAREK